MIQELFHVGSFAISPFGVMLVLAFLASYLQLSRGMRQAGVGNDDDTSALVVAAGLGGIVGAKVYYAILTRDASSLFERSGLVWYGGFLLGAAAVLFVIRRRRLPVWPMMDAALPALALGYGIGRIGCLLVGDDYGRPTDLPWGMTFPVGLPPTTAGNLRESFGLDIPAALPDDALIRVHPTQIYETLSALAIWGIGLWLLKRKLPAGQTGLVVLALLAIERFLVEFLRAKDDRLLAGFTVAQGLAATIFAVAVVLALRRSRLRAA
jgi:phosphatidylglycerol:prolipoprotein diacylglycerol transferase